MTTSTDLPDGFKATPLGLFPQEWDLESIGDLFNIQQGKSLSPKQREGKSPHPFLRTANVYWGKVDLAKVDHMDFTDEEVAKLALQPNDLLVCEGGDIGRTAMWRGAMENCCYQNHLHRLRTNRADVYPEFFMYWMQAAFTLLGLYGGEGNKTTIPNLSQGRLKAFKVPKPSFQEQQAIATVLTAVRRDIESTEAVIAAARETKRAMKQHLFGYGPVPVAEAGAVALKETAIGEIPAHWRIAKLKDLLNEPLRNGHSAKVTNEQYGVRTLILTAVTINDFSIQNTKITDADPRRVKDMWLKAGDIYIERANTPEYVGLAALYEGEEGFSIFPDLLIRVRLKLDQVLPKYVVEFLLSPASRKYFQMNAKKTAGNFPKIDQPIVENTLIPIPPMKEQEAIANEFCSIDSKIRAEEKRKEALETLFSSLLSELMTGEKRVVVSSNGIKMSDEELIARLVELENDVIYQEPATETEEEFKYIPGRIPILLSAPHGAVHTRNGKQKEEDEFTGGFAQIVGQLTGAHIIYARRMSSTDPNFDDGAAYKSKIEEIKKSSRINFVLDIHGIRANLDFGIALGTINWESCPDYKNIILKCFSSNGFSEFAEDKFDRLVVNHPEYSGGTKQNTVTRYCMRHLKVPAAQIELNAHLRIPNRRSDASQPDKSFQGNPVYIVKAIRAICALVQALSEEAPSIQSN